MAFITTKKNKIPLGIYIHVPFCRSKCQYCDFYSIDQRDEALMDEYMNAVCAHIKETGPLAPNHIVDTVYFGGGTPSFFGAEGLATILTAVRKSFDVSPEAEITFEANPDSVDAEQLRRLRAEGFNRVSLGIQCDDNDILEKLGRPHNYEEAVNAYHKIRKAGFQNVSVDLMFGLPGQNLYTWRDTLHNVIGLSPEHISCYGLTLEEGTPLYRNQHRMHLPGDETQADMYLAACEILKDYGYRQYEISNFARRGKISRHNMKYWTGQEYIGFGPNASSDFAGKRYTIVRDLNAYIEGIRSGGQILSELQEIPIRERAGEYVMMRLRTAAGINEKEYERSFLLSFAPLKQVLENAQARGYAQLTNDRWHFTPEGFLISNSIISDLLLAQEESEPLARRRL